MYEISFFTVFLCALAVVPVLLILRTLAVEARQQREIAFVPVPTGVRNEAAAYEMTESASPHYSFERTRKHLRATMRCEVDRPIQAAEAPHAAQSDTVSGALNLNTFEYTIRRHAGALKQEALNMGGFSQVPLLLYDRSGNCFTVHRRLSLN